MKMRFCDNYRHHGAHFRDNNSFTMTTMMQLMRKAKLARMRGGEKETAEGTIRLARQPEIVLALLLKP